MFLLAASLLGLALSADSADRTGQYFVIAVTDEDTGRGVPLVELETVNGIRYFTDSSGLVAFHEPGLMDRQVFFHVKSHGYEFPKDGFGYRGKKLTTTAGRTAHLKIKRINIGQRIYRVTGQGIYRDSVLTGRPTPLSHPVLNGQVLGSDSVVNAIFHGKIYWFWGDTNQPAYPLGNFHVPGATSLLPGKGGLDPSLGVDLDYFLDEKGFAKETAHMPGKGPTWISALLVVEDRDGREQLFASYVKIRGHLQVYQRGLVRFDPKRRRFEKVVQFPDDALAYPRGHPFKHAVEGTEYFYFADPFPLVRVPADPVHLADLGSYEALTCLKQGSRGDSNCLDLAADGTPHWSWKKQTPPVSQKQEAEWISAGTIRPHAARLALKDSRTAKPVMAHRGSVYWNDYRRRWIMIATEIGGTSPLGEVWYAEALQPEGPWSPATKIVTHEDYSFYNPKQHPMFDQDGGRYIYFEGTYTNTFSGNPNQTPRYNYNQVMYKLDLSDPRLSPSQQKIGVEMPKG